MTATKITPKRFGALAEEIRLLILANVTMKPYSYETVGGWLEGVCYFNLRLERGFVHLDINVDPQARKAATEEQKTALGDLLAKILEAMRSAKVEPKVWIANYSIAVAQPSETANVIVETLARMVVAYTQL